MQVGFVFLDSDERNLYQLRQWIQPLQRLSQTHRVAVIVSSQICLPDLEASGLEFHLSDVADGLVSLLNQHRPKLLLYPNQNTLNYFANRFSGAVHAWVSHGESDKAYMSQNTLKRYDLYFAAGQVAKTRVLENVAGFGSDRVRLIGRPQLGDTHSAPKDFIPAPSPVLKVLYAPTWEGATVATEYGSIASHGEELVKKLIHLGYQVIYRSHPLAGFRDSRVKAANEAIKQRLSDFNAKNDLKHHIDDSDFGWQLEHLDFLITDVSAVAYDWLATSKPLIVTKPASTNAVMSNAPLFETLELLDANTIDDLPNKIKVAQELATDVAGLKSLRDKYFEPGDGDAHFLSSVSGALELAATLADQQTESPDFALKALKGRNVFLQRLLRYPNFAIRIFMRALGLWFTVAEKPPNDLAKGLRNLYVHFSDAFEVKSLVDAARELFEIAKETGEVYVATNQASSFAALKAHFWWHNLVGGFTKHRLHIFANISARDSETLITSLSPERVLYLKDHPNNLMMLRLNGTKHFLYRPERDPNFVANHSLTMYDVVVTNSLETQRAVRAILSIARPSLQKVASEGS
jgi:CDP-glycerol glycerophosphotransferase (TagB/SpsB family)